MLLGAPCARPTRGCTCSRRPVLRRLEEGEITELILALGATLEAENTATFIRQMVSTRFPQVRISRLAQGIPLGAEVKYMDKETLRQSLQYRQDLT